MHAPCVVPMSVWCRLSTWCRPILVDFGSILVNFGRLWSILVDMMSTFLSTSCRHQILCRHEVVLVDLMSSTKIDMSLTKIDIRSTYNRQKTTKIMNFDVDIMSTQKSVSISCRHEISCFFVVFCRCYVDFCWVDVRHMLTAWDERTVSYMFTSRRHDVNSFLIKTM